MIGLPQTIAAKGIKRIGFDKINRRTHLYAGLFFLPWFLFYGLSSAILNHPKWFSPGPMKMYELFDRPYTAETGGLRAFADRALRDSGLAGQFAVRRDSGGKIVINQDRFLSSTQTTYDPAAGRLASRRGMANFPMLLTRVHTRGGFETIGFLRVLWAVIVDAIQVAVIVWIASGLYMWWHLRRFRGWGLLALGLGIGLFAAFLLGL